MTQSQSRSFARSSSKFPAVIRAANDGSKKAAGLDFFSRIDGLDSELAAGALLRNIQQYDGQPRIGEVRRDARPHSSGSQHRSAANQWRSRPLR